MKIIKIEDGRKLNVSCLVVGYLEENKIEKLQFEIPEEYKDFGRKACFKANGKTFAKSFDNITDNTLTLTRDMTQYNELEMSIAFFKIENEDEIVARTSILKIYIENAIVCDDDIKPDEPKVVILDELIQKVTELNEQVTKDEEIRQNQEITRQQNENAREEYISNLKVQVDNGDFDGADFNYKWDGTKLGVKNSKETAYQFVELKGDTGNGIQNIEKVSTAENVDTYAIHYTDGTQTTFDVTNGEVTKEQLDEVDNRAKKTRKELERVKNDILETGTASDSFINVQDSAWAELQELSVDGVCKQQTTTGKNLLPNKIQTNTIHGVTCTNNGDGTVTLNGTATAKTYFSTNKNISLSLDGNYTFSANTYNNLGYSLYHGGAELFFWDTKSDKTFSATGSFDNVRPQINIESGVTLNNVIVKFQLEKGSTSTEYEPYTEGQATPSPDYPQEIKTITDSLSVTSNNGKDETEENYLESVITANLPEGEFVAKTDGTYKDTLKVAYKEDGKHHLILNKIISKTVLNGTQPISYSKVINDDKFVAQFNIGTAIKSSSTMVSDKFIYKSNGWTSNSENISTGGSNNNLLQIKILQSRLEEVSSNGLTNWLSTHPVEVYYALEKPYEVDLGIVDMPLSYNEVTNIFTDSDLLPQINAKYYRNFTKTVQNLQINEKALKQELIDINNRLTALETAKASEREVNNDIPVE